MTEKKHQERKEEEEKEEEEEERKEGMQTCKNSWCSSTNNCVSQAFSTWDRTPS